MYDYLIATDEGFKQSLDEKKEEKEKIEDEEEDEALLDDDEEEEKEEQDEEALFAVSDEDMEDGPVLDVGILFIGDG